MKKMLITVIMLAFITTGFSQAKEDNILLHQKDSALPMIKTEQTKNIKDLNLSTKQKKKIKKSRKQIKTKKTNIKKNTGLNDQQKNDQLSELKKEKEAKLQAILTADQKEKIKQTKEIKPRRGVTNMPNERTVK